MSNWSFLSTSEEEEKREEQRKAVESKIEGKKRQFYRSHILHVTVFQGSLQAQFFTILRMPACQNLFYNFRKMQAGQSVAQTSGPKADEAEEDLKRKSTQVLFRSFSFLVLKLNISSAQFPSTNFTFTFTFLVFNATVRCEHISLSWDLAEAPWSWSMGKWKASPQNSLNRWRFLFFFCILAFGGFYKTLVIKQWEDEESCIRIHLT